jgi:hypothetical protein
MLTRTEKKCCRRDVEYGRSEKFFAYCWDGSSKCSVFKKGMTESVWTVSGPLIPSAESSRAKKFEKEMFSVSAIIPTKFYMR